MGQCKHVWIHYSGSKYKQCHDCKEKRSTEDDDATTYKREANK